MAKGTHDFAPDPRNETILINVNGELVPRAEASISVFDSGFMLGDGVWEGLRLHRGNDARGGSPVDYQIIGLRFQTGRSQHHSRRQSCHQFHDTILGIHPSDATEKCP